MPKDEKEDPWHAMETELETAARSMLSTRERYNAAAREVDHRADGTPPPPEAIKRYRELLVQLESAIKEMEPDLQMMKKTLEVAMENPERCKVSPAELQRRQDVFVKITRKISQGDHDAKLGRKNEEKRRAASEGKDPRDERPSEATLHMQQEFERQNQIKQNVDGALARVEHSVKGLENKAGMINQTLVDQDKELSAMNKDMTAVQIKMDTSIRKIDDMLNRASDKGKICIIVVLMIVLVLLVVFLFSGDSSNSGSS
jgi:hypothetical protein